jgi:plastocyanin
MHHPNAAVRFWVPGAGVAGLVLGAATFGYLWFAPPRAAQESVAQQAFTIHAHKYAFEPARIEVTQGDIVKITFRADDIPHSFTVDAYRISKRAAVGENVTFEFRASTAGTFPFYCQLRADDGCRTMHGELVVKDH